MFYLIYKITNIVNNKIYVGKHKTKNKNDDYMGSGLNIRRAIKKYGKDKFIKEIIYECSSEEEMNQREKDIVDEEFILRMDTYNINVGGDGGWRYCNKHRKICGIDRVNSDKLNNKVGQCYIHLNRMKTDENYKKEIIKKISEGMRAKWKIDGHRWVGRKHSEETKRKIGEKNRERQSGKGNSHYGTFWIFNEQLKKSKIIKKGEIIQAGWVKGRRFWK